MIATKTIAATQTYKKGEEKISVCVLREEKNCPGTSADLQFWRKQHVSEGALDKSE